jgi:hypothetical protein
MPPGFIIFLEQRSTRCIVIQPHIKSRKIKKRAINNPIKINATIDAIDRLDTINVSARAALFVVCQNSGGMSNSALTKSITARAHRILKRSVPVYLSVSLRKISSISLMASDNTSLMVECLPIFFTPLFFLDKL